MYEYLKEFEMKSPASLNWPPNFSLLEFEISGNTKQPIPTVAIPNIRELAWILQIIRNYCGNFPIKILSGFRTVEYNARLHKKSKQVVSKSYHCLGMAADIVHFTLSHSDLYKKIDYLQRNNVIPTGGLGLYSGFVHVDYRGRLTRWKGN